jgi:hypothetical protein
LAIVSITAFSNSSIQAEQLEGSPRQTLYSAIFIVPWLLDFSCDDWFSESWFEIQLLLGTAQLSFCLSLTQIMSFTSNQAIILTLSSNAESIAYSGAGRVGWARG